MAAYNVFNLTKGNLSFILPAFNGSHELSISIPPSCMSDILPHVGTIEDCKRIPALHAMELDGKIYIILE